PDALVRGGGQHWSGDRRDHGLGKEQAKDIVPCCAVALPERVGMRQITRTRQAHPCLRCRHAFQGRSNRGIVGLGVSDALLESERPRLACLRGWGLCLAERWHKNEKRNRSGSERFQRQGLTPPWHRECVHAPQTYVATVR